MRCRIRSAATIWYGRITSSLRSTSNTQYFVRMFSSVCLAKNVLVKPVRSAMGLFVASAHQLVNSKLFDVLRRPLADRRVSPMCWSRVVLE